MLAGHTSQLVAPCLLKVPALQAEHSDVEATPVVVVWCGLVVVVWFGVVWWWCGVVVWCGGVVSVVWYGGVIVVWW